MEFGNQSAIDMTVVQVSTITGSYLTTQVTNTSQMAGITEFISKPVTSTRSTQGTVNISIRRSCWVVLT